uniref:Transcriptional regulator n=1 Tax=Thermogemmatispora argillosa TaxID=2045280 RepID=A0A455SZT7_9CHLR|nr:transcriptional regulator [Thermogemmatispora argillosa]
MLAITLLLQARGKMTAQRLASILGVSARTIYRDIDALSLAHVPIAMDYGPGGGYYLADHYQFDATAFTREEAVSLVLGVDMAGNYSLFAGDDGLHRALFKLEAALPEEYRADIKAAREHILFDTTAWDGDATGAFLESIRQAVLAGRRLDLLYPWTTRQAMPALRWLRVDPYGLVYKGQTSRQMRTGVWYLVAFCHASQQVETFRVGYIQDLRVRQERIQPSSNFDLQAYWQAARRHLAEKEQPLAVTLRVKAAARYRLRGNYTVLQEEADGSALVRVQQESLQDAVAYVLSLGSEAVVLSPSRLRAAVLTTAERIAALYREEVKDASNF